MSEHYLLGTAPYPTNPSRVILVKILNAINSGAGGGTGGGSGTVMEGTGAPSSAPTNPNSPAIYTDLSTGDMSTWNVSTQAWV